MTAQKLRDAAARIRETAQAATPGAWKVWAMSVLADQDGTSDVETAVPVADTHHEAGLRTFNATHIALWSPPVALAVADWLDQVASNLEDTLPIWETSTELPGTVEDTVHHHFGRPLAVADLILGGAR